MHARAVRLTPFRCRESTIIKALSFAISTLTAQIVIGTRYVALLDNLSSKLLLRIPNRRAYALSGFDRKLLAALLSIGLIYFVLAVALIHTIIIAGRLHSVSRPARRFLTRHQLDRLRMNPLRRSGYVYKTLDRPSGSHA